MSLEEAILDRVHHRQPAVRPVRTPDRTRETRWIRDNRSAYADQWVAVEGDRLIAAGMDA